MKTLIDVSRNVVSTKPGKPDHAAAVEYNRRGWGKFKNRSDWENSLRYQGKFEQPEKNKNDPRH